MRGHNIVADEWAGASNLHLAPTHPQTAHKHQKGSLSYFLTHAHGRMDQRTDKRTDKVSHRVESATKNSFTFAHSDRS